VVIRTTIRSSARPAACAGRPDAGRNPDGRTPRDERRSPHWNAVEAEAPAADAAEDVAAAVPVMVRQPGERASGGLLFASPFKLVSLLVTWRFLYDLLRITCVMLPKTFGSNLLNRGDSLTGARR
jgi:hypothetical protein